MLKKQRVALVLSFSLPVVAGVALETTAEAFADCLYAGQSYSPGACIQSVCSDGKSQICLSQGEWSGCANCDDPPPL